MLGHSYLQKFYLCVWVYTCVMSAWQYAALHAYICLLEYVRVLFKNSVKTELLAKLLHSASYFESTTPAEMYQDISALLRELESDPLICKELRSLDVPAAPGVDLYDWL